uniref:Uncharacterized protein n=1 Tax=Corvus moneduloides TaxID=1196302 RepID=A0A8U7P9H5_CORMO
AAGAGLRGLAGPGRARGGRPGALRPSRPGLDPTPRHGCVPACGLKTTATRLVCFRVSRFGGFLDEHTVQRCWKHFLHSLLLTQP